MIYPFNILNTDTEIAPIFGDQISGKPYIFDFSESGPKNYATTDFDKFQEQIFDEIEQNNKEWGVGLYLENRTPLLKDYHQMIDEKRVFHAGVDIMVPAEYKVYAPIDGEVYKFGIDEGLGNYGGYVIMKHALDETPFYAIYGHLNLDKYPLETGQKIKCGEIFAETGERANSGWWFTHIHVQIITQKAVDLGRELQGYITHEDLGMVTEIFPSPYHLLRY